MRIIGRGLEALAKFIEECLKAGGTPTFVAQYGERPFADRVIVRCYGAAAKVPGGTIIDVPPDILELIRRSRNDWKVLVEELKKRGITIHVPGI